MKRTVDTLVSTPSSRSCVSVGLPSGVKVALDVSFLQHSHAYLMEGKGKCPSALRSVLLVQSLSHWAPLCIGPYAQCNSLQGLLVTVSGQIPLQPGSMQLLWNSSRDNDDPVGNNPPDYATVLQRLRAQTVLCMRHVQRVLACCGDDGGVVEPGGYLKDTLHVTLYLNLPLILAQMSREGGTNHDEEALTESLRKLVQACVRYDLKMPGAVSPSNMRHGQQHSVFEASHSYQRSYSEISDSDGDYDDAFDENDRSVSTQHIVPVTVVGVRSLPREALVEVEAIGSARSAIEFMRGRDWVASGVAVVAPGDDESTSERSSNASSLVKSIESWPFWQTPALSSNYSK